MFARGLTFTLLLGPGAPSPAPRELLFALTSASAQTATTGRSGFQLVFDTAEPARLRRLLGRAGLGLDSTLRAVLVLTLRGRPYPLIDGVVTQHQVNHGPGGKASFILTGEDLTNLMDRVDASGRPFPGMGPAEQVAVLLASYAALGVVPLVVPPLLHERPDPRQTIPTQQGTDLDHISMLARRAGHVFTLRPGPLPGQSVAYWGPEVRVGDPQPALSIDLGARSNIDAINFTHAVDQPALPIVRVQVAGQQLTLPLPPTNPLRPVLGAVPQPPARVVRLPDAAGETASAAILRALSSAAADAETVSADASVDLARYGQVVYPRDILGVRGAASPYNGLYCVTRVSTELRRGACTQRLSFTRAGLFSSTPTVRV